MEPRGILIVVNLNLLHLSWRIRQPPPSQKCNPPSRNATYSPAARALTLPESHALRRPPAV
jgi:hypothetical protein